MCMSFILRAFSDTEYGIMDFYTTQSPIPCSLPFPQGSKWETTSDFLSFEFTYHLAFEVAAFPVFLLLK